MTGETGTVSLDYEALSATATALFKYADEILSNLNEISQTVKNLEENESFKTQIGSADLQGAITSIQPSFTDFKDLISKLATVLTTVIENYQNSDANLGQAYTSWFEEIQNIVNGVTNNPTTTPTTTQPNILGTGLAGLGAIGEAIGGTVDFIKSAGQNTLAAVNTTQAEGENYNLMNWGQDMLTSAGNLYNTISQATRTSVNEAISALGNTSKLYSHFTGHSLAAGATNVISYLSGTAKTLFNTITNRNSSATSFLSSIFKK